MSSTRAKQDLEEYLYYGGFGRVETEVKFHPTRKWRADYFLPDQNKPHGVIVEYDGFLHRGRNSSHASIGGILRDSEKGNAAQAMGIKFFRANAKTIGDGSFFTLLNDALKQDLPMAGDGSQEDE